MMRVGPQAVNLSCPRCSCTYPAELTNIIDVEDTPNLKLQLLSGELNVTNCPSCHSTNPIVVPILYHDSSREFCITHIPSELNLSSDQQEKIVGELLTGLMSSLSKEDVRGYLFQPRSSLTLKSLREQILTLDGYSDEEIQHQKKLNELLQLLFTTSNDKLDRVILDADDQIDEQFITAVSILQSRLKSDDRADSDAKIDFILKRLLEVSTAGIQLQKQAEIRLNAIQSVRKDIEALGESPSNTSIQSLAMRYLNKDAIYLELLVGAMRPAFDYSFYQEITAQLSQADHRKKEQLIQLREKLLEASSQIDQARKIALDQADALVSELSASVNISNKISKHLPNLDQYFFQALGNQLVEAERSNDKEKIEALRYLQETVLDKIDELMSPEVKLLTELLEIEDFEAALIKLKEEGLPIKDRMLSILEEAENFLVKQNDPKRLKRLSELQAAFRDLLE